MNILIVDDERPNREGIHFLLKQHYPQVQSVYEAASAEAARKILNEESIDVILLDVNMPKENGFDLLNSVVDDYKGFVVFVTAYAEYAIRAFKANAVDYLLKPIDPAELVLALEKCRSRMHLLSNLTEQQFYTASLQNAGNDASSRTYPQKISLAHLHGFQIVAIADIVYLEADGNYTTVHLKSGEKLLVTRGIKEFEQLLDPDIYFRVHKSAIVNLNELKEYSSIDGPVAVMENGTRVMISRRKLDDFMTVVQQFAKKV